MLVTLFAAGCGSSGPTNVDIGGETPAPEEPNPGTVPGAITAAWVNDGGDKVTRDELRGSQANSLWDGKKIRLTAAKNEVVSFNLVLEAAQKAASQVHVEFNRLAGPGGREIATKAATQLDGVFDWSSRPIENFYVRYLQIKGLSLLSYEHYDERHIPRRMRRPFGEKGKGRGTWQDRPDHDKFYPEIAVPHELVPRFEIASKTNQSVWTDIYIPRDAATGTYRGAVKVLEGDKLTGFIPVEVVVRGFALPDEPTSKAMAYMGASINRRYTNEDWPDDGTAAGDIIHRVRDRHFQLAHRHKIALIDNDTGGDEPSTEWLPRLSGELFTPARGYGGPGQGVGNGVYSIGSYGKWGWQGQGEQAMWQHSDRWENWFKTHAPKTERFLYLIDESSDYAQIEQWARWMLNNPGPGRALMSFATVQLPWALPQTPSLSIAASWFTVGIQQDWADSVARQVSNPIKRYYQYNGKRPSQGSFATEDEGVALRELPWAQYKKGVQRWMFWESTYYNDYQTQRGQIDVYETAATFSGGPTQDSVLGETGWNHSNGDGVLFYPGTDRIYPRSSYGAQGPIASLRLKHWRRGIQDVDYIALARARNPAATQAIVERMVPKAMWEYGVETPNDPTYVHTDISWSINPDDWETARAELARIIAGG